MRFEKVVVPHVMPGGVRLAQVTGSRGGSSILPLEPGQAGVLPLPPLERDSGQQSFLRVRGLPPGFKLSAGFATKDAWLVSLNDAEGLAVVPAPDFRGAVALDILLVRGQDTIRLSSITVSINSGPDTRFRTAARIDPAPSENNSVLLLPPDTPKRTITPEAEANGLKRAEGLLGSSDIAAARMVYETLALKGSGKAAIALGQTFDPAYLSQFSVQGLKPDVQQARKWYKRALDLGEALAQQRLSALGQ